MIRLNCIYLRWQWNARKSWVETPHDGLVSNKELKQIYVKAIKLNHCVKRELL